MNIYAVGGAIRDELLGLPVQDYDYVVVGSTPEQMMAQGYRAVGQDFPVFLHPHTQAEYALARTERKTARGYHGFQFYYAPDVTLEQDLARRDLTINAMARAVDAEGLPVGPIIDPYHGQTDLKAGILRHVSQAFTEDPVRILRVARFAARLPGFVLANETLVLMRSMVAEGEVDALVPERVWQEISQGLMAVNPWHMFEILHNCGALTRILPELAQLFAQSATTTTNTETMTSSANITSTTQFAAINGHHLTPCSTMLTDAALTAPAVERTKAALQRAAMQGYKLPVRFATLAVCVIAELGNLCKTPRARHADADSTRVPNVKKGGITPPLGSCRGSLELTAPSSNLNKTSQSVTEEKKNQKQQELTLNVLCQRLKVPNACRDLALLAAREIDTINNALSSNATELVQLLERCDALRKPARFAEIVQTCEASRPPVAEQDMHSPQTDRLREALVAMHSVDAGAIAKQFPNNPTSIKQAVHEARIAAVEAVFTN